MRTIARSRYAGYRFPAEIISHAVWLYFRFPLGLRLVEELLAARGIVVSHETVRQWARKFGQAFANQIRRRLSRAGDKWHLDEAVITIAGQKHWLWRAVDQTGLVLDVLVQSRRDKRAANRLLRKLLKRQGRPPRVLITDKLASYPAAKELMPGVEHRRHKGISTTAPRILYGAIDVKLCSSRFASSRLSVECVPTSDDRRGARLGRGESRHKLVFGWTPWVPTMMQSCASAAKLRGGGPILTCGLQAIFSAGSPPPRIILGSPRR